MAVLPTDVITGILRVLPVKTLTRFKCVSKSWDSLIKDPHFVKLHLHHSLTTNNNVKLVLDGRTTPANVDSDDDEEDDDDETYSVDFDSLGNLEQLPRPFITTGTGCTSRIFGSYNGLLAVYHNDEERIALWNPSTRTCHHLPRLTIGDVMEMHYDILGFGYDVIDDDYKVVRMMGFGRSAMVYSLKTDSWKRIKDCPYQIHFTYNHDGAYANGSLHWVGDEPHKDSRGRVIFGLYLGAEEFHRVPEPEVRFRNLRDKHVGGVLGGSLCVFGEYTNGYDEDHTILGVMKEYGVKESWTELVNLSNEEWQLNICYTRAVAYSPRGDQVLLDDGGFSPHPAWLDLAKKTWQYLHNIPGAPARFSATIYVETLVSALPMQ
ncbi:hypothetical protein V6N13_091511 [Hibiscus sabdariffa]|uniref:F-box domain-containing protein n=1 Tax=Hibiscus sabdariffa TaxID=183260 RepID=A0ABR2QE51_9ROSI